MINRNNYEAYFLMYIDNELSSQECVLVEEFLQQNSDLKQEFELLQQSVLVPDITVQFENKHCLKKQAYDEAITIDNFEEKCLLYIDNELIDNERDALETFVLRHPNLQHNFTLLKLAKLSPEPITYLNKEKLYRSKKNYRIVYINWRQMGIAAALIGVALITYMNYFANNTSGQLVKMQDGKLLMPQKNTTEKQIFATNDNKKIFDRQKSEQVQLNQLTSTIGDNKLSIIKSDKQPLFQPNTIKKDLPIKDSTTLVMVETTSTPMIETIDVEAPNVPVVLSNNILENNSLVQNTNYQALNVTTDDDKKSLYIGAVEINKENFRGFIRRARSLISKPNTEGNSVAVASFAIK